MLFPASLSTAPFATVIAPPAKEVPLLAVKVLISKVPPFTIIFPASAVLEYKAGRFATNDFVPEPLIIKVE